MNTKQVFINYASEDREQAMKIFHYLKKIEGIEPWIDKQDILPGIKWEEEITQAIESSYAVLIIISRNSVNKRGFVQKEIRYALNQMQFLPAGKIFTIPVRLEKIDPSYIELRKYQYADLFPDWEEGMKKIAQSILKEEIISTTPSEVMEIFENIIDPEQSFDNIKDDLFKMNYKDKLKRLSTNHMPLKFMIGPAKCSDVIIPMDRIDKTSERILGYAPGAEEVNSYPDFREMVSLDTKRPATDLFSVNKCRLYLMVFSSSTVFYSQ